MLSKWSRVCTIENVEDKFVNNLNAISCRFVSGPFCCLVFVLLALVSPDARVLGQTLLDHHHRELMEARVEDLASRLSSSWDLQNLPQMKIKLEPMGEMQTRTLAGFALIRLAVRLRGQVGLVLTWLSDASSHHLMFKPPLELRAENGMGRPVVVDLVLWKIAPGVLAGGASDEELTRLRDDLLWHESGLEDAPALLSVMETMMNFEQVRLQQASLEKGILSVRATAVDEPSEKAFRALLEKKAKLLSHAPQLDLDIRSPVAKRLAEAGPPGMMMKDCPVHQAVSSAGIFTKNNFIFVSEKSYFLNGFLSAIEDKGLFSAVIEKTGLGHKRLQDIVFVSDKLEGLPVSTKDDSTESLAMTIHGMKAAEVLRRIGRLAKIQVLVSDDVPGLITAKVKGVRALRLLSVTAWALGLKIQRHGKLVVVYDGSLKQAHSRSSLGKLRLNAYQAPLKEIVQFLAGMQQLRDCTKNQEQVLDLNTGPVDASQLLDALLTVYGKNIRGTEKAGTLVDAGAVNRPDPSSCDLNSKKSPEKLHLYALASLGRKRFALLGLDGKFSWHSRGDDLGGGLRLARIHKKRVVLTDQDGQTVQVFLGPEQLEEIPRIPPGPTRQGLSDLRLVGTINLPERFAIALAQNRMGEVFWLWKGLGIGRRCGKVTFIGTDRIGVNLGCAIGKEPQRATLYLQKEVSPEK